MKILITGGGGFLGRRLARKLLERNRLKGTDGHDHPIEQLILLDIQPVEGFTDARVHVAHGDIGDPQLLHRVIDPEVQAIFHLAAIVSAQAEADFDLGMRINVDASRSLLEVCRAAGHRPKIVFTSSVAVFGGKLPETVLDSTAVFPQSSYGAEKAIVELLISDYSRRGFVDGRVVRLPTISVRPGRPNKAASSFASGIIREPLNGEESICPVGADIRLWLLSPRKAIDNLIAAQELSAESLADGRVINVPGVCVRVSEMVAALERVAGAAAAEHIVWQRDPSIERIVGSWPGAWDTTRAVKLGLRGDPDFETIIRNYMEDDLPRAKASAR